MIKRNLTEEDTRIAMIVSWFVGVPVFTIFSFYFGTIAVSPHVKDLQTHDMSAAVPFAIGGFVIGVLLALGFTFIYPKTAFSDLEREWHDPVLHHEPGGAPDLIEGVH